MFNAVKWISENKGPALAIIQGFEREFHRLHEEGVLSVTQVAVAVDNAADWSFNTTENLDDVTDTSFMAALANMSDDTDTDGDDTDASYQGHCLESLSILMGRPVEDLQTLIDNNDLGVQADGTVKPNPSNIQAASKDGPSAT